jgi:hypothetical protein
MKYTPHEIDKVCDRTNLDRFSSHYGFPPQTVAAVLNDNPQIRPKEFFMTLYWWKSYQEEFPLESRWKWHPETIRNKLYKVCGQLGERYAEKIVFGGFEQNQVYLGNIDCVHFEWEECRTDPGGKWYSHKHNGPGLSYEVCVDAVKDRIIWTNGPFPAATHDITIFRGGTKKNGKTTWKKSSLYHKMPVGTQLVGDLGYAGEPDKLSVTLQGHSDETKELFARLKSRGETLFRGYKSLGIMGGKPFRHKGKQGGGSKEQMAVHKLVFRAITVVMQYNMESGRPLFDV